MSTTLLLIAMMLHPVHETVSEIEWNEETKRLEVALRLDGLDAQWIERQRSAKPGFTPESAAVAYLQQRYRIAESEKQRHADHNPTGAAGAKANESGQQDPSIYHWVGSRRNGAHVWWYFEIEPRDGRHPTWIDVSLLFDSDPGYTHRVLLVGESPKRSLTLTQKKSRSPLQKVPES